MSDDWHPSDRPLWSRLLGEAAWVEPLAVIVFPLIVLAVPI